MPLNNWSILIKLKFPSDPATRSFSRGVSVGIDRPTDSWQLDLSRNSVDLAHSPVDGFVDIRAKDRTVYCVMIKDNWNARAIVFDSRNAFSRFIGRESISLPFLLEIIIPSDIRQI